MCMTKTRWRVSDMFIERKQPKAHSGQGSDGFKQKPFSQEYALVTLPSELCASVGFFHAVLSTLAVTVNRGLRVIDLGRHNKVTEPRSVLESDYTSDTKVTTANSIDDESLHQVNIGFSNRIIKLDERTTRSRLEMHHYQYEGTA